MSTPGPADEMLTDLRDELGAAGVTGADDAVAMERHQRPARGEPGVAAGVVRPASTDQVRTVVAAARRHLVRLIPQGANSGLVGASTPTSAGDTVVLSLERLSRPPLVDPDDRVAVVDAGVLLSTLNDAARPHGLSLPIDLGSDPSIGGMVATNTGGARMIAHGDMRDHVLGVRAVLADEDCSVIDELTTLRKNNVGPSLGRLLIGSGGALGVVTQVAVELEPLPAARACAWITPVDEAELVALLGVLEARLGDRLSAFEVLSPAALRAGLEVSRAGAPAPTDADSPRSALVEVSGPVGVDEELSDALMSSGAARYIADAVAIAPGTAWAVRHGVTEGLARRGVVLGHDVSVPRPRLAELVRDVSTAVPRHVPRAELADFGHWGDGGVHCSVVFPADAPPSPEERGLVNDVVFDLVGELDGSYSGEHGIGPVNARRWTDTTPAANRALLAAIAGLTDPLGILGHPGLPYRAAPSSSPGTSSAVSGAEK